MKTNHTIHRNGSDSSETEGNKARDSDRHDRRVGTLFVVATPIGNLSDLSARTRETLQSVDFILCEDTRVTRGLLAHCDIHKNLVSLHHHSTQAQIDAVIRRLSSGESATFVSDAGTPGISDPGGKLVAAVKLFNTHSPDVGNTTITLVPIPGPSAVTAALSVCGFPADEFQFLGFAPKKKGRQTFFASLVKAPMTTVFFESPHRIEKTLQALAGHIPDRDIMLGRELTKLFETLYFGTPSQVLEKLKATSAKGEYTIVVSAHE